MYEVNWCVVGTQPDSLPFYFDSWDEAFEFLKIELYHLKHVFEEFENEVSATLVRLHDKINITDGKDVLLTVGNLSYWILELGKDFGDSLSVEDRYHL